MDNQKVVVIVKTPNDNDIFLNNHTIIVQGRIPGELEKNMVSI
jgi:hypothetical protein